MAEALNAAEEVSLDSLESEIEAQINEDVNTELGVADTEQESGNLDSLRAKIKAARLEKLMARQLESELSTEDEVVEDSSNIHQQLDHAINVMETIQSTKGETTLSSTSSLARAAASVTGRSNSPSKRLKDVQTSKSSCDEMLNNISKGSNILNNLTDQTKELTANLEAMEKEFIRIQEAEAEAERTKMELGTVNEAHREALSVIKKQEKQIQVLETMRNTSIENYESAKLNLEELQRASQKQANELAESQFVNSELEQEIRSLQSNIEHGKSELQSVQKELEVSREEYKQKDMEAAKAQAELYSSRERISNLEANLQKMSQELEEVSSVSNQRDTEIAKLNSAISTITENYNQTEDKLGNSQNEVEALNIEIKQKDISLNKLNSEFTSLMKLNEKTNLEVESLQDKYNQLNRQTLDQQSQHYSRINELEGMLRDAKRKLDIKNQEKTELAVELKATNNLLMLHEEMVSALSNKV